MSGRKLACTGLDAFGSWLTACRTARARWVAHGDLVWTIVAGVDPKRYCRGIQVRYLDHRANRMVRLGAQVNGDSQYR